MKKTLIFLIAFIGSMPMLMAQTQVTESFKEWKIVTVVESIIPMGLGRSRMIENLTDVDTEQFRTTRTDGRRSSQRSVSRRELKVDNFDEAKLLNFFSAGGINFQNIASNDAMIGARVMELESEGYSLVFVTSAVESYAGTNDDSGIFITRMFFSRQIPANR
jgi:hypothetical protein